MKAPQWIVKLLATKTNYPPQILTDKIKDILDSLDVHLSEHTTTIPSDSCMIIKPYKIGLFSQVMPTAKIVSYLISQMPEGYAYIPRSIAFVCEPDGTWCFRIAFRGAGEPMVDKCEMFIDLLDRTNYARSVTDIEK